MEVIRSSETLVHIRSTRRHIPKDGILHSHRRENLKSYKSSHISQISGKKNIQKWHGTREMLLGKLDHRQRGMRNLEKTDVQEEASAKTGMQKLG
jgi:hypothetical protein